MEVQNASLRPYCQQANEGQAAAVLSGLKPWASMKVRVFVLKT